MRNRTKKCTAWFFLIIFGIETFYPSLSFALTSGPAQPELTQFEPAGVNDLVDLFSGDFKYNIPLMDVGGYPINLSYHSGEGMEDEASWVGFGWTLNPGTINRQTRGLPDDFNGDKIEKTYDRKEFKKIGGQVILKPTILAWETGIKDKQGSVSINIGVYKDNYYGVGASFGLGVSQELAKNKTTTLTAGLNINSDNRDGATLTPSFNLSRHHDRTENETIRGLSGSLAYNTRAGLKQVDLGATWAFTRSKMTSFSFSAQKYFGQTYTPSFNTNTSNNGYTLNFDLGPSLFGGYIGIGGSGYYYQEKIDQKTVNASAYGYMNYLNGRKNTNALLDFNRENDGPYVPGTPAIPVPVPTFDLFDATGQAGSQQFRPYFNGNYVVFDKAHNSTTRNLSAGVTVGVGNIAKSGGRIDYTSGDANTQKWVSNNDFLQGGEPDFDYKPDMEPVGLKTVGEIVRADDGYLQSIQGDKTVQVVVNDKKHMYGNAKTWQALKIKDGAEVSIANNPLRKNNRDRRTTLISYLNAAQASQYGLDKQINNENRVTSTRLSHHLSEITVTDNGGQRMVYGIPVYNTKQVEASFSVDNPTGNNLERALKTGLIEYTAGVDNSTSNTRGRDNMFSRDVVPGYATAFLLTGILSPDYVDVGNDGITDDDLGTAYKFSYARTATNFKWRTPYASHTANFNQGFVSDLKDDKASYSYGEKELWYMDTIESKTMIAIFIKSDREDGLGVQNEDGGKEAGVRLKKLDRIELYSKADWVKDKDHAVPVKVVHFEYDYSTHRNVANNTGKAVDKNSQELQDPASDANVNKDKGKLTLKRVYFTFGNNKRGQSNPYEFTYEQKKVSDEFDPSILPPASYQDPVNPGDNSNPEITNSYTTRQQDRWGTYKPTWYNHLLGVTGTDGKLTNAEFPYALQENDNGNNGLDERKLADLFASMWQLNKIVTPTGSTIYVDYETDEYGYVQNKRAMQMCMVNGVGSVNNAGGMMGSKGFTVELPKSVSSGDFQKEYLEGADGRLLSNIYYKIYTNLDNKGHNEYVQGYAEIDPSKCTLVSNTTAFIAIKQIGTINPVAKAAWQMLKSDLPQYAYDNYDNSDVSLTTGAIKSLIQAVVNMKEFVQSFDNRAKNRHFADNIDLAKSMIRLYSPENKKMGGGARVKQLTIEDAWHDMSHNTGVTAKYGQKYEYSGGVASYEPQIGNEENPFHQPVPWTEKVTWAPDKYHFVDLPFCETYFPAPSVGYSKVTVTNFGDDYAQGGPLEKNRGYVEHEFYTAKEFPTFVDYMPLQATDYENNMLLKLFSCTYIKRVATSQGFKIELNDMHGKAKSVKVFNKAGDELSSTETYYNVDDDKAAEKHLNNYVDITESSSGGKIETDFMGTDIDLATDVRESSNQTTGAGIGAYFGTMMVVVWPIPYMAINYSYNRSRNTYHSVSMVKVVHKYGIVKKVVTRKNGSSIEAENVLWDGETGAVLLTKTQNEFNDYTYSFNYPAYWAEGYEGMGAAYKNINVDLPLFQGIPYGNIIPSRYSDVVFPGDELIGDGDKKWVMKSDDGQLRIIDRDGQPVRARNSVYTIVRSGRRNMMSASAGSIVCMNNPVVGTGTNRRLQFNVGNKILDAKSVLYSNEWGVPVAGKQLPETQCDPFSGKDVFSIDESSAITCNGDFMAAGRRPITTRSYMDFLQLSDLPANTTIVSAKLTLYPLDMRGNNGVIFSRVTETVTCGTEGIGWYSQPAISTSNQVVTSSIPFTSDPYVVDVTGMVNDWYTSKDNPVFGIGMQQQTEAGSLITRLTSFYGAYADHLGKAPKLDVCYLVKKCYDPVDREINPYVQGMLGNWRPKQSFVYMVDREQKPGLSTLPGGTDIRTNGAYTTFNPFWNFRPLGGIYSNVQVDQPVATERWVWNNKSVYYDRKGNEIETVAPINRDAQGNIDVSNNGYRYSTALYGYRESEAIAVATNARHNEIAFDGFEDYYYTLQKNINDPCPVPRHFDWGLTNQGSNWCTGGACLATDKVHSGKYSLKLNGGVTVTKPLGNAAPPASILRYNNLDGSVLLAANELAKGFSPVGDSKQYLASMWVYDGKPDANTISGLSVNINSQSMDLSKPVPVVEGWKQLVIPFTVSGQFQFQLTGSSIYIDDVRIFPYDANMRSFVYDDRTMRLLAQLDENNFATFYEYDDEGTPIRVKKETEKGIMTLKENRQSFKQR